MKVIQAFIVALLGAASARAAVMWDESVNGDLSSDRANPSAFVVSQGDNLLSATSAGDDREYVRLTVPAGLGISAINLNAYSSNDSTAFIAVQSGPVMTVDPEAPSTTLLLGYSHFGPSVAPISPVHDYLPTIAVAPGAIGFSGPLGEGSYTFWIQQREVSSPTSYQWNFVATPAPEPAGSIMIVALLPLANRRRG